MRGNHFKRGRTSRFASDLLPDGNGSMPIRRFIPSFAMGLNRQEIMPATQQHTAKSSKIAPFIARQSCLIERPPAAKNTCCVVAKMILLVRVKCSQKYMASARPRTQGRAATRRRCQTSRLLRRTRSAFGSHKQITSCDIARTASLHSLFQCGLFVAPAVLAGIRATAHSHGHR